MIIAAAKLEILLVNTP